MATENGMTAERAAQLVGDCLSYLARKVEGIPAIENVEVDGTTVSFTETIVGTGFVLSIERVEP